MDDAALNFNDLNFVSNVDKIYSQCFNVSSSWLKMVAKNMQKCFLDGKNLTMLFYAQHAHRILVNIIIVLLLLLLFQLSSLFYWIWLQSKFSTTIT